MSFRSGRPTRRYVIVLCVLALFVYYSGRHLGRNSTYIPSSSNAQDGSMEYVKPQEHEVNQQDGYMEIDHDLIKQREREVMRRQIDQKYCGRDHCRFMLPIAITEQESKAQEHFRQLSFLSGKLGRTIVLPNVHSSHLGACRHFPFSFYYSSEWLERNKRFFNYITMEDFREWISERQQTGSIPTSQEVVVDINPNFHFLDKAENCFKDLLDYTDRPRKHFTLEDPETFSRRVGNYTEILLNALDEETLGQEYVGQVNPAPPLDVISLYYDRRFGYIEEPQVAKPLTYNDRWIHLADQIANQLSPYVAIHWRMERLDPVDNMVPCAESLVSKVQSIEAQHDQQPLKLFLLTDYPHLLRSSIAQPESMSFKLNELKQQHHDAIEYVYERLDVTVTTLQKENQPIPYNELPEKNWNIIPVPPYAKPPDSSVLGIVDKLVAMRAQYFLAGKPTVCGKQSSFTKRIMEERTQAYEAGDSNIILPLDIFSL